MSLKQGFGVGCFVYNHHNVKRSSYYTIIVIGESNKHYETLERNKFYLLLKALSFRLEQFFFKCFTTTTCIGLP